MKGMILAAADATALRPATRTVAKALLPVSGKVVVYHPISTLMQARLRNLLVIVMPKARSQFEAGLGDGSQFGGTLSYAEPKIAGRPSIHVHHQSHQVSDGSFHSPSVHGSNCLYVTIAT